MAAITPTKVVKTEFAGKNKIAVFTCVPGSASDTLDLSSHFDTIHGAIAQIETGQDSALQTIHCTFSGTTVTLTTQNGAGGAATDWTGATARVFVVGEE